MDRDRWIEILEQELDDATSKGKKKKKNNGEDNESFEATEPPANDIAGKHKELLESKWDNQTAL